jgi:hypothetical protein
MTDNYRDLDFGPEELSSVMRETYDELIEFVTTPGFRAMHRELMSLPPPERPAFVGRIIMQPFELGRRGIQVPEGILIETSAFGDRRPTLFVVKKYLPARYRGAWENVNITFDSEYEDAKVSRDPMDAWRPPLPVALQNAALAGDIDLEALPNEWGVNYERFARPEAADHPDQRDSASKRPSAAKD